MEPTQQITRGGLIIHLSKAGKYRWCTTAVALGSHTNTHHCHLKSRAVFHDLPEWELVALLQHVALKVGSTTLNSRPFFFHTSPSQRFPRSSSVYIRSRNLKRYAAGQADRGRLAHCQRGGTKATQTAAGFLKLCFATKVVVVWLVTISKWFNISND